VYIFGMDPAWKGVDNEIQFYNGLKMKMAIVIGVIHQIVGIFYSALNALAFHNRIDFFLVFIPSMVIFLSMFGYLAFMIILKWCIVNSQALADPKLLTIMIDMFLSPFNCCVNPNDPAAATADPKAVNDYFFDGQGTVQQILFVLAVISIPTLLCAKPCVLLQLHKRRTRNYVEHHDAHAGGNGEGPSQMKDALDDNEELPVDSQPVKSAAAASLIMPIGVSDQVLPAPKNKASGAHGAGGKFDTGEVFMHSVIHTIEFVLGSISNTASYLRLWALSLAHSELAIVFWQRAFIYLLISPDSNTYTEQEPPTTTNMMPTSTMSTMTTAQPPNPAPVPSSGSLVLYAFAGASAWLGATVAVLMILESLSAFLHALRLHWVEFQNKFYLGDGHKFLPFSFDNVYEAAASKQARDQDDNK